MYLHKCGKSTTFVKFRFHHHEVSWTMFQGNLTEWPMRLTCTVAGYVVVLIVKDPFVIVPEGCMLVILLGSFPLSPPSLDGSGSSACISSFEGRHPLWRFRVACVFNGFFGLSVVGSLREATTNGANPSPSGLSNGVPPG
jgi:hypothetical protein